MTRMPLFLAILLFAVTAIQADDAAPIRDPNTPIEKLADGFTFTEGPAVNSRGDIYFVDDPQKKIYFWSVGEKKLSVFVENSFHANGLYVDADDNVVACEGGNGCVVSYDPKGKKTVLAAEYDGKRFNKPNDLWIDPRGGIYFTDPTYGDLFKVMQGGEHVYYITPDRAKVLRVADDLVKPNGIIGTPDGKTLYVTDHLASKVWRYRIQPDGTLAEKTLFAEIGIDGMTIDERGNVYITERLVIVFNPDGKEIDRIKTPDVPANVCFGGPDGKTLFITARNGLYSLRMNVAGGKRTP